MKALIFSDSHGMVGGMIDAIMEHKDINLIIHAGDMQRDVDDIMNVFPEIPCACVAGNNEYYNLDIPEERLFEFGGKKDIFNPWTQIRSQRLPCPGYSRGKKKRGRCLHFRAYPFKAAESPGYMGNKPGACRQKLWCNDYSRRKNRDRDKGV